MHHTIAISARTALERYVEPTDTILVRLERFTNAVANWAVSRKSIGKAEGSVTEERARILPSWLLDGLFTISTYACSLVCCMLYAVSWIVYRVSCIVYLGILTISTCACITMLLRVCWLCLTCMLQTRIILIACDAQQVLVCERVPGGALLSGLLSSVVWRLCNGV